ncbi:MAG: Multiple sugar-binding protein precursor [Firmicutes bacterium ADurb.Bin419]|nr:MAG: Multiple sugar-binding protein precursor [Firmicutes bacterium ADurb.Bin419]
MDYRKFTPIYKTISLLLVFSVLVFFTACSSGVDGEEPDPTPSADNEPVKAKDAVTVRFMVHGYKDVFDSLGKEFTSQNPDINVEILLVDSAMYDQVKAQKLMAGDVELVLNFQTNPMQVDWAKGVIKPQFQQEIEIGYYADLTDMPNLKNWKQSVLEESAMLGGRVYAVPFALSALNTVFYNKKIFRENNLEVPETWSEFVNICKVLQERKIKPILVGAKDSWPLLMISNAFVAASEPDLPTYAKQLWTGERKYNDEKSLKIWEKGLDFVSYLGNGYDRVDYVSVPDRFAEGEAAMLVDGSWQAFTIKNNSPSMEFGCFTLPGDTKEDDPVQISGKYDIMISVNNTSPNREAALKWLEFLCDKQNYKKFVEMAQVIPVVDIDVDNEFIKSLAPYLKNPTSAWEHVMPVHVDVRLSRFSSFVQFSVIRGSYSTPTQLADAAQREWELILESINNEN